MTVTIYSASDCREIVWSLGPVRADMAADGWEGTLVHVDRLEMVMSPAAAAYIRERIASGMRGGAADPKEGQLRLSRFSPRFPRLPREAAQAARRETVR